jgi:hypothetical protein
MVPKKLALYPERFRVGIGAGVLVASLSKNGLRAQDTAAYKVEIYEENQNRVRVHTHTALFEQELAKDVRLRGSVVYDAISGATPSGGAPQPGSNQVPLRSFQDDRYAGTGEADFKIHNHTITPSFAYSVERDYESSTPALHYTIDLNQKNTTLLFGVSHNFDRLTGIFLEPRYRSKYATDGLVGITQILSPDTWVSLNFTLGEADGYLSDPYKGVTFTLTPDPSALFPDKRPGHRTKEVTELKLNQFVEAVNGGAELGHRFYHDSFGITSQTVELSWFQNVGRFVVVTPMLRFYDQTSAYFYAPYFIGDPSLGPRPGLAPIPTYYSSDYRISRFHSWTYGLSLTARLNRYLSVDVGFKRYRMFGDDKLTPASNFINANSFTFGVRAWF